MKRFFKIHALLVIGLFVLVSGTDATLEHMEPHRDFSSVHFYDAQGRLRLAYEGDLAKAPGFAPIVPVAKQPETFSLHLF